SAFNPSLTGFVKCNTVSLREMRSLMRKDHRRDPDMLVVGRVGWDRTRGKRSAARGDAFKDWARKTVEIIAAKVFVCSPGRNFVTLKIQTDEGVFGLGGATLNGRELAVVSYLEEHVIPCLIGRDPFETEDIWQYLYRGAYWRGGPVTMTAIAAVDMALWDIKGKALNTAVYNLLGGKNRKRALGFVP